MTWIIKHIDLFFFNSIQFPDQFIRSNIFNAKHSNQINAINALAIEPLIYVDGFINLAVSVKLCDKWTRKKLPCADLDELSS